MSENTGNRTPDEQELTPSEAVGEAERAGHGGSVTEGEAERRAELAELAEDPFADPGLPAHRQRRTDVDPRAARRAERQVAAMFMISILGFLGFSVALVVIPPDESANVFPIGTVNVSNLVLGLTLGVALFCVGAGAIHWARKLMVDKEIVEERRPLRAPDDTRAKAIEAFDTGTDESGFLRFKLIRRTLLGALALFPVPFVVALRDLGPAPGTKLRHTAWADSQVMINESTGERLRPEHVTEGSMVFAHPESIEPHDLDEMAKASVMLVRIAPNEIKDEAELEKGYEGIVCFSKICTHVGCPVGLYEQQTRRVLCPCHQSTFDLAEGARVTFGPAGRPLPQLAITVDDEGYLVARGDFDEPVGPSFWERG